MNHLRDSLSQMVQGQKPSPAQLRLAFDDLLDPDVSPPLAASWLTALRMAGENAETLAAAVDSVMARMVEFGSVEEFGPVRLDTCGTGGYLRGFGSQPPSAPSACNEVAVRFRHVSAASPNSTGGR